MKLKILYIVIIKITKKCFDTVVSIEG